MDLVRSVEITDGAEIRIVDIARSGHQIVAYFRDTPHDAVDLPDASNKSIRDALSHRWQILQQDE